MDHEGKIRDRAYELWVEAGMPDDKAADHWAQAEVEIGADNSSGADGGSPELGTINASDD
ncbi:DUF2934 domain-containing protein [Methylopila sp. M107]|uniref:DUF2934 domain-containing protein n=1 Tax=Methylopila sp. M107 TaxID=1101190 RepID=UPI0003718654|nr:DUF2934 domain-containing protein [Methylopila sp. M107]